MAAAPARLHLVDTTAPLLLCLDSAPRVGGGGRDEALHRERRHDKVARLLQGRAWLREKNNLPSPGRMLPSGGVDRLTCRPPLRPFFYQHVCKVKDVVRTLKGTTHGGFPIVRTSGTKWEVRCRASALPFFRFFRVLQPSSLPTDPPRLIRRWSFPSSLSRFRRRRASGERMCRWRAASSLALFSATKLSPCCSGSAGAS